MKTFSAKKQEINKNNQKWYVIDLSGKILGRVAVAIANIIRGKHKPQYTPHVDTGDFVVAINANKIALTGQKWDDKIYHFHSKFVGHMKDFPASELMKRHPEWLIKKAVWGMLPKNKLARQMIKKLKIYATDAHPHVAQKPEVYQFTK